MCIRDRDEAEFEDVRQAMRALQVGDAEEAAIWDVVAAVLVLGDVDFVGDDAADVVNFDTGPAQAVAALLRCDAAALKEALVAKNIGTRSITGPHEGASLVLQLSSV